MKRTLTVLFASCFIGAVAQAEVTPVVSAMFGFYTARIGKNETISLISPFTNTYKVQRATLVRGVGGLFAGGRWWFKNKRVGLQFGLAGYFSQRQKVRGVVWQFSDPNFDNFNYRYYVRSERVMLQSKLLTTFHKNFHPYLSFGIGMAFNTAYEYKESPRISTAVPAAPFSDHTTNSLAVSLGVGLNYDLNQHWEIGAGYQYVNLGSARLSSSSVQADEPVKYIRTGRLYANEFLLNVSYLF